MPNIRLADLCILFFILNFEHFTRVFTEFRSYQLIFSQN